MILLQNRMFGATIVIALAITLLYSINALTHLPPRISNVQGTPNAIDVEISTSNYSIYGTYRKLSCIILVETKSNNKIMHLTNKSFNGLMEIIDYLKNNNVIVVSYKYSQFSITDVSLSDVNRTEKIVIQNINIEKDTNYYILGIEYSPQVNIVTNLNDANQPCVLRSVRQVRFHNN